MLRREQCYWSPSYSRHLIVSAKETVSKLLKQSLNGYYSNQIPKSFFLFINIDIASRCLPRHRSWALCYLWENEFLKRSFFAKAQVSHIVLCWIVPDRAPSNVTGSGPSPTELTISWKVIMCFWIKDACWMRDDPYCTTGKNSQELIQLPGIKVSLV